MTNEINAPGMDRQILAKVLEGMRPEQVREWFIKYKMAERRKSYRDMASRHRVSAWYLAASVSGKYPFSQKVVKTLEAELIIDLTPFLNHAEAARCCRKGLKAKPAAEEPGQEAL